MRIRFTLFKLFFQNYLSANTTTTTTTTEKPTQKTTNNPPKATKKANFNWISNTQPVTSTPAQSPPTTTLHFLTSKNETLIPKMQ